MADPAPVSAGTATAKAPDQISDMQKRQAVDAQATAPVPAPGGGLAPPPATVDGLLTGLQMAHSDFVQWWYKPHGAIYDTQMTAMMDGKGVRREFVGYGLLGLAILLLCTPMAPLVANLICIVYPLVATLSVLRGQENPVETTRLLTYWAFFAVLSITDYKFGSESMLYWVYKILVSVYLYLPQTQGAVVIYSLAIRPLLDLFDAHVAPKFA